MQTPSQVPELFIFRGMVRNEIMKFRVFFSSENGSERNSELFLSSAEQTEFRRNEFPSLPCSTEYFFLGKCQPYWLIYSFPTVKPALRQSG
jgi:hypothetical protein